MLSESKLMFYRDNGYVVASGIVSSDEAANLRAVTDGFIEKSRRHTVADDVFDVEDNHTADNPRLRRLKIPEQRDPAYEAMLQHPGVIAVLKQLLGPNIRKQGMKLNLKPGRGGEPVEWHQDWGFFPHTNDDLCIFAIMLDDVAEENGPMMVVPGSHKGKVFDHHQDGWFAGAITDLDGPAAYAKAVLLTGKAGDIHIHHVRTLHASAQNLSEKYRPLLFITAAAADAWPLGERPATIEEWDKQMICGESTLAPRLAEVPVRLPYPRRLSNKESIFEKQRELRNSPFERLRSPDDLVVVGA
jgi:phytanoyl-CoA hydroxylase